jgi:membrane associated rhomboid family serine protease
MFLLPLRTDSPLRSTPYMNWLIILANVLVFAATATHPDGWDHAFALQPRTPTLFQFISYQFLHAGFLHIIGNMLFLFIFGNNVNDKMGNLGYLAFYIAGGIVAGVCYAATEQRGTPMVGASGAIAAVTGAYLILFPRSMVTVIYWFYLIGKYEIQSLWFILAFFALDVFGNFANQDNVAHMAHIGGTVFGSVVCLGLVVSHLLPRDQWDVWALIQRWNKRRQYRDLVSRGYNPFDYTQSARAENQKADDPNAERVQDLRERINAAFAARNIEVAAELYVQMVSLDPAQLLSRQNQLDVANQLYHNNRYVPAAEAYEKLLKSYPNIERYEQIELMVGILYSRYLNQFEKAKQHLGKAIARLHEGKEMDLARDELRVVELQLISRT